MKRYIVIIPLICLLASLIQVSPKAIASSADCSDEELGICYDGNECRLEDSTIGVCDGCTCVPISS